VIRTSGPGRVAARAFRADSCQSPNWCWCSKISRQLAIPDEEYLTNAKHKKRREQRPRLQG